MQISGIRLGALVLLIAGAIGLGGVVGAVATRGQWLTGAHPPRNVDDQSLPSDTVIVVGAGEVDVEGGLLALSPMPNGIVRSIPVKDGQKVKSGAALCELDASLADAYVEQARIARQSATLNLQQAQQSARQHELLKKQQKLAQEVAETRLEAARAQLPRIEKNVATKLADELDLKAARDQIRVLEQAVAAEKLRLELLRDTDAKLIVELATRQMEHADQQLDAARKQRGYFTLAAPEDGVVLRVTARLGQVWSGLQRDPAVWFRPDRPWIIRCEIDQQYAHRVHAGMPCTIHDDQQGTLTWTGKVQSCSVWIGPRRTAGDDTLFRRDVRTMECIVAVDNADDNLRIGQRVRVVVREQNAR